MGVGTAPAESVQIIAAMVTPALLILGSASLVASALVRMARVVDRSRALTAAVYQGTSDHACPSPSQLRVWLERHAIRARYVERSILLLYAAVAVFIATCLALALERVAVNVLPWLSTTLAFIGTLLLLGGGAWMVAESRMSGKQIAEEIALALERIKG
jgi:hypothetical protein